MNKSNYNQVGDDELRGLNIRMNSLAGKTEQEIQALGIPVSAPSPVIPTVTQLLRNGDGTHSSDTWFNAVPSATDQRYECAHFYTHAAPTVGQQLKEDSVHSGVVVASSFAVPDAARSDLPVTADPDWVKSKGIWRLGSTKTLDTPLSSNCVYPGMAVLFCGFRAARAASTVTIPGRLYAGLWDNTLGQRDWLRGGTFTLTGSVIGTPAATTTRKYKIIVRTDQGFSFESNELTLAGAPTDPSFVSNSVYVSLSWQFIPGALAYDVYRLTGATYEKLASIDTTVGYYDQNPSTRVTVGGYPVTTDTKPKAYVATSAGALDNIAVDGVDPSWDSFVFAIPVAPNYDRGPTTDKQWLRIGMDTALTGTGHDRGLLIDFIWLSLTNGSFANHPEDLNRSQQPASAPPSSATGGTGVPPAGGEGGPRCVTLDTLIDTWVGGRLRRIPMRDVKPGMKVDGGDIAPNTVLKLRLGWADKLVLLETKNKCKLRCTPSHRLITTALDKQGIPASNLNVGDQVLTKRGGRIERTVITKKRTVKKREMVQTLSVGPGHFYIADRWISHNAKPIEFL